MIGASEQLCDVTPQKKRSTIRTKMGQLKKTILK